ncbi:hypothetical protein EBU58_04940 [bacterium]|nr:hypothetical protein [bacterium]
MSDYLENKLIDQLFRGQSAPTTSNLYVGLLTAAPSDSGGGTEVATGSYARVAVTSSLANWAGTQAAASTSASSGTGGQTSNNNAITFPTPTASWGTVTHFGIYDASTGGNLLFWGQLTIAKTINEADTVTFPAASLSITFA